MTKGAVHVDPYNSSLLIVVITVLNSCIVCRPLYCTCCRAEDLLSALTKVSDLRLSAAGHLRRSKASVDFLGVQKLLEGSGWVYSILYTTRFRELQFLKKKRNRLFSTFSAHTF